MGTLFGSAGYSQTPTTRFETDFSPGAPTGNWYDWVQEMTISCENEETKVDIPEPVMEDLIISDIMGRILLRKQINTGPGINNLNTI